MASKKASTTPLRGLRPADDPEAGMQYKHRGIYEIERLTGPRIFFFVSRMTAMLFIYAILTDPEQNTSVFDYLPTSFYPSKPPSITTDELSLPLGGSSLLDYISATLKMPPTSAIVFLMMTGISVQFCTYVLVWRREALPMTGDGAATTTSVATNLIDIIQVLIFFYGSERNPTWNVAVFRWMPLIFGLGLFIQFWADQQKHMFKQRENNNTKVLQQGLWSLVRAPNFTGFLMWRLAQSVACLGWVGGLMFTYANFESYRTASGPSIEQHMSRKYGKEFDKYKRQVPHRLIPGVY